MALDLTAGGKLTVSPFVNERKALRMAEMIQGAKMGGYAGQRARTDLAESLTSSDAPHAFAALTNYRNLPLYEETEPDFDPITDLELVPDFNPITFYAMKAKTTGGLEHGKDNQGNKVAPRVAEGDTYQYAFEYAAQETGLAIQKRGYLTGWSLEKGVNDTFGLVTRFPQDMLKVARKTDQYVVIRALIEGATAASELQAGTDPITGEAVDPNAPLSASALRAAFRQIAQRTDANGVRVSLPSRFQLVVPVGTAQDVELMLTLARGLATIQDGVFSYNAGGLIAGDTLGRIGGVIESEFVADGSWYLVPEKGTTEVPTLIRAQLAGYTAPEVYVSNWNGSPIAGAASADPFTAYSFSNDTIDLKVRQFTSAVLFSEDALVHSDGSGA